MVIILLKQFEGKEDLSSHKLSIHLTKHQNYFIEDSLFLIFSDK
jgi:hypothetical protein